MPLLLDGITFLNFDRAYVVQERLRKIPHEWIDCLDIPGTNRYCRKDSLRRIGTRLKRRSRRGVTFLGSGNYHYVSLLLLSEIREPFTLVLFDHHTDMMPSPDPSLIACGSWLSEALERLPLLRKAIVVGAQANVPLHRPSGSSSRVAVISENEIRESTMDRVVGKILTFMETDTVYISIDKDVLDPSDALTQWDQGSMRLPDLLAAVRQILVHAAVCGLDVCGELPASPLEMFQPSIRNAVWKNETANRRILNTVRKHVRNIS
jgi:arginase family enzyme